MDTLVANGKILDLSTPQVMGIINMTPDSFHRGSRINNIDEALDVIQNMITEGATMIDIGGQSSRPRAEKVSAEEELKRIGESVSIIRKAFPNIIISIDTFHSTVAEAMIETGIDMINDISAGSMDANLIDVVANSDIAYVLMHMLGTPDMMQDQPDYENVVLEILNFLKTKVNELRKKNLHNIIIDPGFGFGKTVDQNYNILKKLNVFNILECPIMVGLSRKSMIYKVLEIESAQALNGTSVLHFAALQNGAKILRVHDVKEAIETITLQAKVASA